MTARRNTAKEHFRPGPAARSARKPTALLATAVMLSLTGGLTGCMMVGPDYVRPETNLQPQWLDAGNRNVTSQPPVEREWWSQFNDPVLDDLVRRAYRQNLPLQVTAVRVLEARARLAFAIGQQYPQSELFGSIYGVEFGNSDPSFAGNLDTPFINYRAGFDAVWELDLWGRFRRGVQAAGAEFGATVAEYDASLVTLQAEVARTYTLIRTYQVLIELAMQNIQIQEDGLRIAQSRFRNGATTELDVTQARTLLESTRTTVPQLQATLQQANNALCILLGEPPGAIVLPEAEPSIPAPPADVAVGVPADLLRQRPDVRAAELTAVAQANLVGVAEADLYPALSLFGQIGLQTTSEGGARTFDDSLFYTVGPTVNWPIFNFDRIENSVRVEDARLQQALIAYQHAVLEASAEVENALTGFLRAQEAAAFAQEAVVAANRSVELATAQYREGAVDFQRVLDSQRALLQEQNTLAQARSTIATSWIALYKALGGGWELRQGQPLLPETVRHEMRQRTDWGDMLPTETPPSPGQPPSSDRQTPPSQ